MKLNEKKMADIKERLNGLQYHLVMGDGACDIRDGFAGTTVYRESFPVCKIEDISKVIRELETLKEAIEEETGLVL